MLCIERKKFIVFPKEIKQIEIILTNKSNTQSYKNIEENLNHSSYIKFIHKFFSKQQKKCSICEINQSDNNSSAECVSISTATSSSTATPSLALNSTITETSNELSLNATNNNASNHNNSTTSGNSISKYTGGHVCVQCNCKSGCKLWFHVTWYY